MISPGFSVLEIYVSTLINKYGLLFYHFAEMCLECLIPIFLQVMLSSILWQFLCVFGLERTPQN